MEKRKKRIIASTLIFFSSINTLAYATETLEKNNDEKQQIIIEEVNDSDIEINEQLNSNLEEEITWEKIEQEEFKEFQEKQQIEKDEQIEKNHLNRDITGNIAANLEIGETVETTLGADITETRQYKIETPASGYLNVFFTSYTAGRKIKIITDEGQVIESKDVSGTQSSPNVINLKLPLDKGKYYIEISNNKGATAGKFKLKNTFTYIANSDKEPNNDLDEAIKTTNGTTIKGFLAMDDYADYYKINVKKDGILIMNVKSRDDFYYTLWDTEGLFLKGDNYNTDWNKEPIRIAQGFPPGDYYIGIHKNRDKRNFYGFEYELKFNLDYVNVDDVEPNNDLKTANKLELNQKKKGFLNIKDNFDLYKIAIPKDMKVYIEFTVYEQLALSYVNPDGSRKLLISSSGATEEKPIKRETTMNLKKGEHIFMAQTYFSNYGLYDIKIKTGEFEDIFEHWAEKEINEFITQGILDTNNENFRPDDKITRAEFIKIVNKTFGFYSYGDENFTDVNSTDWFYNEVRYAVKAGYISTSNSEFRPYDKITREEAAKIIVDIKKQRDDDLDKIEKYKDFNKISKWARSSVEGAVEHGYMGRGSDYFRPLDNMTRAEAVTTLYRVRGFS